MTTTFYFLFACDSEQNLIFVFVCLQTFLLVELCVKNFNLNSLTKKREKIKKSCYK